MSFEKPWGNYLLEAIIETQAPEPISFWPQTIAWQIVLVLLIIMAINKSYQTWKKYQANAYRREALAWLAQCSLSKESDIRQLPALLRKVAIIAVQKKQLASKESYQEGYQNKTSFMTQEITNLSGKSWVTWLDEHSNKTNFIEKESQLNVGIYSCEKLLDQLAYVAKLDMTNKQLNTGIIQLIKQIKLWITDHSLTVPNLSKKTPEKMNLGDKI